MGELLLTDAQNGSYFTVRVDDVIVVALAENAAAGFRWLASSLDEKLVALEGQEYRARDNAVGSAGTSVWRFRAMHEGRARLDLKKARPWDPDSATERFSVSLEITG